MRSSLPLLRSGGEGWGEEVTLDFGPRAKLILKPLENQSPTCSHPDQQAERPSHGILHYVGCSCFRRRLDRQVQGKNSFRSNLVSSPWPNRMAYRFTHEGSAA